MTNEALKRANEIQDAIDAIGEVRDAFLKNIQISVNQTNTQGIPPDIICEWREMNIEFLEEYISKLEKEFENL